MLSTFAMLRPFSKPEAVYISAGTKIADATLNLSKIQFSGKVPRDASNLPPHLTKSIPRI
jgi:hypothetical protein